MRTLAEFLPVIRALDSREAVRWLDAYRTQTITYLDLYGKIGACSDHLEEHGIRKGDRVMIRTENRPEWVAFFWACVARGVHIVPVDFRFSNELAARIHTDCHASLIADSAVLDAIGKRTPVHDFPIIQADPNDIVEIVYTSGATGEPKGIIHRHRNICANLDPFAREIAKYRRWAAPFQPIRILDLLPLSHMFGQSMGLYIPLLLGGAVAFTSELHPGAIMRIARDDRISVIVSVPRILEVLREQVERQYSLQPPIRLQGLMGVAAKWWKYRRVHSTFGWKFWAFVVGGARVDPDLEEFWGRLGFIVVQGYGLTEASPVVAVNHPFSAKRGSLGRPVPGQEVRIASDGEILVRGESVAAAADESGWLHTGDLGEIDAEGRLYYRGRKKDIIVTGEGLNVFPEDVEAILDQLPEVKKSAVVNVNDHVHAALILRNRHAELQEAEAVVREANQRLEAHQRIQHWSLWPNDDFPRTASTLKIKRNDVAALIAGGSFEARTAPSLDPRTMSSLERVELLTELEARHGMEIDEAAFSAATTAEELKQFIAQPVKARTSPLPSRWPRSLPVRAFRAAFQRTVAVPLFRHYLPITVAGLDYLDGMSPPAIFAANHSSHMDTAAIFTALPPHWRNRLAPAMLADHFRAHFEPARFRLSQVWASRGLYALTRLIYNAYPLPHEMAGVGRAFACTADLVQNGYCPLVYPEGRRTPDGTLQPFRPGIGMMAVRLHVPVVPVHIAGLFDVYSVHHAWPVRGPVRVTLGAPLTFPSDTGFADATQRIEAAIRSLCNK